MVTTSLVQPTRPSTTPASPITRSPAAKNAIEELHPLDRAKLAIEDNGQAPWRLQSILTSASLMFERESKDPSKQALAQQKAGEISESIALLRRKYGEIAREADENDPTALKLKNDMEFMETMNDFIQSRINGLVSVQRSLRYESENVQKRYDEVISRGGWIDRMIKQIPLLSGPLLGAAAFGGGAWQATMSLLQHNVPVQLQPIAEGVANFLGLVAVGSISFIATGWSAKRKARLLEECGGKQAELLEKEKLSRMVSIALIKNKATQLFALHRYLLELEVENPEVHQMAQDADYEGLKRYFSGKVQAILNQGGNAIPAELVPGAEVDSLSSNLA